MKVGIIGCGGMGLHHAEVIRKFPFVNDVICCDLSEKARLNAEAKGFRTLPDIPALLALPPDAVFVVTQASAHAACIRPCLDAGVPGPHNDTVELTALHGTAPAPRPRQWRSWPCA